MVRFNFRKTRRPLPIADLIERSVVLIMTSIAFREFFAFIVARALAILSFFGRMERSRPMGPDRARDQSFRCIRPIRATATRASRTRALATRDADLSGCGVP